MGGPKKPPLFDIGIHSLTLTDGAGSTGLRQAVALPHGAAQADVHEVLRGGRERRSTREQHPHVPPEERAHPLEHQTVKARAGDKMSEGRRRFQQQQNKLKAISE